MLQLHCERRGAILSPTHSANFIRAPVTDAAHWKPRKARPNPVRALREGLKTALLGALVSLCINIFVAQAMVIQGPSMKPSLAYNQRVIVEKITYSFIHGPRRGGRGDH